LLRPIAFAIFSPRRAKPGRRKPQDAERQPIGHGRETEGSFMPNLVANIGVCVGDSTIFMKGGGPWVSKNTNGFSETMSKRRKGFPSETRVKRGVRIVHGNKELAEKLGRNDLCPCGSAKRFKKCCLKAGSF